MYLFTLVLWFCKDPGDMTYVNSDEKFRWKGY